MTDNGSATVSDVRSGASEQAPARNAVFAAPADDPRARRPVDVFVLVVMLLIAVLGLWGHTTSTDIDERITEFFAEGLPGWISSIFTLIFIAGGIYPIGLLFAIWIFGKGRGSIARDMLFAGAVAIGFAFAGSLLAGPEWPDIFPEVLERGGTPSYPLLRLSFSVAIITVASPYLSVPMRTVGRRLVLGMCIAALVLGYGDLSTVIGGLALGRASAAVVHLLFGSGVGIPSKARITEGLRSIRLEPTSLEYLDEQPIGATLLRSRLDSGDDVLVKVYGRDAADAATASRIWRSLWYRSDNEALRATGLQQVEHEALLLLGGDRVGAPVPELVSWGRGVAGDALIATRWLDGKRLNTLSADEIDDGTLAQCWTAVNEFRENGAAHREIDRLRIVVTDDGVILDDLQGAQVSPDALAEATDIAQMLVATAIAVGPERAIAAARAGVGDELVREALPVLQTTALSSTLQSDVKDSKLKLKDLRSGVAEAIDTEAPELVQLERVTWANVAMVGLSIFAAYALISALADIGFQTIVDEMSGAIWAWVVVAFVLAQLTNVGEYVSLTGMVDRPVPFGPTIMFRYALSFVSLAVPSEAGAIAMNIRYMQKLGVPAAAAVAQGPLLTVFSKGFDVILLLIAGRIIGQTVELDDVDSGPVLRLLILALVLVVVGVIVTFAVPKLRHKVLPPIKEAVGAVRSSVTDPARLLRVAGGTLMQKLLFAMTLSASVAAYGESLPFGEAIFVNSAISLLVGLMPVPGGIGVAEAALTAALTAVGIPEGAAIAAAITHRIVTAYLPPVYGWYTMRWLGDRDYL